MHENKKKRSRRRGEETSSSSEEVEVCDPCKGRCSVTLHIAVLLWSLLKSVAVGPFATIITIVSTTLIAVCTFLRRVVSLICCRSYIWRCCKVPSEPYRGRGIAVNSICQAWFLVLFASVLLLPLQILAAVLCGFVFGFCKPIMDTWTAWKYNQIWYLPAVMGWVSMRTGRLKIMEPIGPQNFRRWWPARDDKCNGTSGVLCEAVALTWLIHENMSFPCDIMWWMQTTGTLEKWRHSHGKDIDDVQWCGFFNEVMEVGKAAIDAGLITRMECAELEPFLMVGLPALVLLRHIVRTCGANYDNEFRVDQVDGKAYRKQPSINLHGGTAEWDRSLLSENSDNDDVDSSEAKYSAQMFLQILVKALKDQSEATFEFWDGYNIIAVDLSDDLATNFWWEAKEAVENGGYLESDSEDEKDLTATDDAIEEYAILEAWLLYGERAPVEESQESRCPCPCFRQKDRAGQFLQAFEALPTERRTMMNKVAAKIRSLALLISKSRSFQSGFMQAMEELGQAQSFSPCCFV